MSVDMSLDDITTEVKIGGKIIKKTNTILGQGKYGVVYKW